MKLRALNHWLTLAANVGVMVGIVFLAYELQQNTIATQLEAATSFQTSYSDIEVSIYGDQEFAALLVKGREDQPVDGIESLRLQVFHNNVMRHWQTNHLLYVAGALDEDIWSGNREFMKLVLNDNIGLLRHWQMSRRLYSPAFNEMIESIIDNGAEGR